MIGFFIGIYLTVAVIAAFLYFAGRCLGGGGDTLVSLIVTTFLFAAFWPLTIWFIGRL